MITFSDVTKQVNTINDLILTDMSCATEENAEEASSFSRHLMATKNWYSRISWANKKRYVLALLEDVRSAWALSLLLKSLWNCRPKDAVLSVCEKATWSSYDEVPTDHNRTALPTPILAQVMKSDRVWFLTLEPEAQAIVLSELLTVAGGPVMWAVLARAQVLYGRYRDNQLQNICECLVVNEQPSVKPLVLEKAVLKEKDSARKNSVGTASTTPTGGGVEQHGRAQKELEQNLAIWNSTIKSMKDTLKLEELVITFNDGTKRKIWKVNRPKPEIIETVDFLQLLPSCIGKRIMSYLPPNQLNDLTRINKYWAYLVDEFKLEQSVRLKLQTDFEKLQDIMLRHDTSLEQIEQINLPTRAPLNSQENASKAISLKTRPPTSIKASEKSGGIYSMRHFLTDKLNKSTRKQIPIRNMSELSERLDQRGAADENLWSWCDNIVKLTKSQKQQKSDYLDGVLTLGNVHFPCPLMKQCLEVPLNPPLYKDPAMSAPLKQRKNISSATVIQAPKKPGVKRYSLWSRDLSGLYPAYKIPSYQSPV